MFNLYAKHITRNASVDELQAGIKIGGRNINNLRCVDDTTVVAESKEELRKLLMRVKEESETASLRLNPLSFNFHISKTVVIIIVLIVVVIVMIPIQGLSGD